MTYLELFQELARKCGVTVPTTTVSQGGESLRLLGYINASWLEVQGLHNNWNYMWGRAEKALVADTQDYAPKSAPWSIANLSYINPDSMTLYDTSEADECRLKYIKYMRYRRLYDLGTHTADKPTCFTILPDRKVRYHPTPDDAYTAQFDYYLAPTSLSGDADEPEIPNADLHWIIVHGAWRRFGEYEESADVVTAAQAEYGGLLARLRREELPLMDIQLRALA